MAVLLKLTFKDSIKAEQEIQRLGLRERLELGHRLFPIHGGQERLERLGHHARVLTDVERCEVQPKHSDLEHELADLVQIEPIELRLDALLQSTQAV